MKKLALTNTQIAVVLAALICSVLPPSIEAAENQQNQAALFDESKAVDLSDKPANKPYAKVNEPEFNKTVRDFSESKPSEIAGSDSATAPATMSQGKQTSKTNGAQKTPSLFEGSESTAVAETMASMEETNAEAGLSAEVASAEANKNTEANADSLMEEAPQKEEIAEEKSKGQRLFERAKCESLPQRSPSELWAVAECFKGQRDYTQAVASLQELVRKDPQDLEATFVLAWLIWEQGRRIGGRREQKNTQKAVAELMKARNNNPTHWLVDVEIGDFYFLRMNAPDLAYAEYLKAREHAKGDFSRSVNKATMGRRVSIENRIARTAVIIGRRGEAVEASCNALYMDPDDPEAEKRIRDLSGSCERKGVENPLLRVPANQDSEEGEFY